MIDSSPVPEEAPPLVAVILDGDQVRAVPLPGAGSLLIGRDPRCDLQVDHPSVSRRHARLHLGTSIGVEDLHSANGTRLGERRLPGGLVEAIVPGQLLEVGRVSLVLQRRVSRPAAGPAAPPATMAELRRLAERVAPGSISVLLHGETGVGKEILAEVIHRRSPRAHQPFLRLNCAALAGSLLESELFGHERGAFTGALQAKPGLLESADGGTVLLDEIGDLPAAVQVTLLRVLEDREVRRVGATSARRIDVRFLAATHRDLEEEIAAGRFRQDLYYRLAGITLEIPPLRQRRDEIRPLAEGFIAQAARPGALARPPRITAAAWALLEAHSWPGNVRELRNVMERAALLAGDDDIGPQHLPLARLGGPRDSPPPSVPPPRALAGGASEGDLAAARGAVREAERRRVVEALARCGGNQSRAAELLGCSRRTLHKRLDEFALPRPRKGRPDR